MQLDSTRVSIHERGLTEILDLSLHLLRVYWKAWLGYTLLGAAPLMLVNYALLGNLIELDDKTSFPWRFVWDMGVLVYLEAPLASIFLTTYLGQAVFQQKPTVLQVLRDVLRYSLPIMVCQILVRGVGVAWFAALFIDRHSGNGFVEGFVWVMLLFYSSCFRAFRPFINEIILLEKNPLVKKASQTTTIGIRSSNLHNPSSGDLVGRWILGAFLGGLLWLFVAITANTLLGVLASDWGIHFRADQYGLEIDYFGAWYKEQIVYPLTLWLVAGFFTVVRYLSYLDLRIRHEGWEVELLMKAEAIRLGAKAG